MASEKPDDRVRYLRAALLGFTALLLAAAVALPPIISGGYPVRDPVLLATAVALPVMGWQWLRLGQGAFRQAALAFVWTSFLVAWVFTIAIQGSGYLVGNYAYLTTIVLFAAFFLDTRQTILCAAANLAGVIVIHNVWGLSRQDLALSVAYLVVFSTLLILIARLMERDRVALERKSKDLVQSNRGLARVSAERQALLDHTQDGILHFGRDGSLRSLNRRAAQMFSDLWDAVPAPGDLLADLAPLEQRPAVREVIARAISGPVERTVGVAGRIIRVRVQALHGSEDGGLVAFLADITAETRHRDEERKLFEQRLEMEKLEEVNRMQKDFINVASHELQTPLTPLRLQVHVLRDRGTGPLNSDQLRAVEIIERNTVRLGRLVEEIMDIVRLENRRVSLRIGDVELVELTEQHVEQLAPLMANKQIRLELERPHTAWIRADAHRVSQVVGNLLANAVKFTPHGGRISIHISSDDPVCWTISDSGIGIDPGDMGRLFQPFTQVHGAPAEYGGTGLGLAISKGLVEAQGGVLEAISAGKGAGATFRFTLPRAAVVKEA